MGFRPPVVRGHGRIAERAARQEQAAIPAAALDRLLPDYREVIILRQFEGLALDAVVARLSRCVDVVRDSERRVAAPAAFASRSPS